MSTQYLKVIFPEQRDVLLDQASIGFTNERLRAESGDYEVTLSGSGYLPAQQNIVLVGAPSNRPLIVEFSLAPSPVSAMEVLTKGKSKTPAKTAETVAAEDARHSRTSRSGASRKKATPREATPPTVKKKASRPKPLPKDDVPGDASQTPARAPRSRSKGKSVAQTKAKGKKNV